MRLEAIDHVQLAMPAGEESRARAFYSGVLGLAEVPKPPVLAARGGAWFASGSVRVHLGVEADFRPARKAHPAFRVLDLGALAARCRAAGLDVVPDTDLPGCARFYVDDPFGNRLEFLEPQPGPGPAIDAAQRGVAADGAASGPDPAGSADPHDALAPGLAGEYFAAQSRARVGLPGSEESS